MVLTARQKAALSTLTKALQTVQDDFPDFRVSCELLADAYYDDSTSFGFMFVDGMMTPFTYEEIPQ